MECRYSHDTLDPPTSRRTTPSSNPQTEMIPTVLANAFNTMSLSDPTDAGWYMDTGATAHLTAQPSKISSLSLSAPLPLVTVGNGALIPATAIGHSSFPSSSRPLVLKNVLLCPQILKNLISVQKFTNDNIHWSTLYIH